MDNQTVQSILLHYYFMRVSLLRIVPVVISLEQTQRVQDVINVSE